MPWSTEDLQRLVDLESQRQNVDPRLSRAVVSQESEWNPNAVGDNGNSIGLFQLQPGAAKDAGLHPRFRSDPAENIKAGVTYLKQKLTQSGGNVEQALSRYNRGTPDYRGIGDPNYVQNVLKYYPDYKPSAQPQQKPGILARVSSALSPASAEASTPQASAPQTAPRSRLEELEAELARREGQAAPQAPTQAPTSPQAPAPVSQTTPAPQTSPRPQETPPQPDPSATPGMRFQALPSITQLEPTDRIQKTRDFERLKPELQEEFLRSEEPTTHQTPALKRFLALPSIASLPDAEREAASKEFAAMQTTQQEEVIKMEQPGYWSQRPAAGPRVLPSQVEAPVTESLTAPSTMIPLLMPGAGLKFVAKPAADLVRKQGVPWATRGARALAEGLSQTAGWTTGRTIETGQVPSPGEIGTEAALNVAAGGVLETLGATGQSILRRSQAGKAIVAADEATTAARAKWQADTQAEEAAAQSQQKELYDTAVIKAKASQRDYEMAVRARQQKIDAGRQEYDEAVRAQQADDVAKEQARTQKMTQRQEEYTGAIQSQEAALTQARAVPMKYAPDDPSWRLYEKYGDAAKDTAFDLAPSNAALAELRAQRGVLPDGTMRPFPKAVEDIVANLEKATGPVPFETIRQEIRKLGPLTRHGDGNIRGPAKQVMGVLADVLDTAPGANDLLKQANANFRREMAVKDMDEWLKPGHGIVSRDRYNREKIDVAKLFTKLDTTMNEDALFRGSFTPDEREAIRAGFGSLAGTPNMPRQPPRDLAPVRPGTPPEPPREPAPVALPADVRVKQVPQPAVEGDTGVWPTLKPIPEPAPVTPREALGERPKVLGPRAGEYGAILATLQAMGIPTTALAVVATMRATQKQGSWLLANAMLSEKGQRVLRAAMDWRGTLNPRTYGALVATLTPSEKKAYERETREKSR